MLHRELVSSKSAFRSQCECWCKTSGPSKRPQLLKPSEISELNVDTDSDEARVSSDISSVVGDSGSVPGLSQPQPYHQTASSRKLSCSFLSSASDWQWEWARQPNSTASNATLDMPLLLLEQCSTHIYRGTQRKGQWSITHKWRLRST